MPLENTKDQTRSRRFIGIDGGGTKTSCVIGDESGAVLAVCHGESSNMKSRPWEEVKRVLAELISQAMELSQSEMSDLAGAFLGLAGADRPEDKEPLYAYMKELLPEGTPVTIHNDAVTVLAAGTWGEAGIVLISGTGSIAYGFLPETDTWVRAGGWGYLLGDEGSGYDMGRQALIAVMRQHDGRGGRTRLTDDVLKRWSLADPNRIITYVYSQPNVRTAIAELARLTLAAAWEGDEAAGQIVARGIDELAELAVTVRSRLAALQPDRDLSELPLVLSGGLFADDGFMNALTEHELVRASGLKPRRLSVPPVAGCYVLALKQAGVEMTEAIRQRISAWETGREV
ncbi:N-acetylglucosamine kinase [Paenibacillus doosanensis]|uniref:N-acetylglucosamine kinase n=1 Tax=Paenibacillus doosanensis TaxID=1229154 RepID=UPI00217F73F5|nr:BadF/BadG/BcrA/BcrD ATPase family protein [Paenibacillus doosanensis]MCS7463738.1 N-acetylglucosamine kinase [Paenibacillus doosanensis]